MTDAAGVIKSKLALGVRRKAIHPNGAGETVSEVVAFDHGESESLITWKEVSSTLAQGLQGSGDGSVPPSFSVIMRSAQGGGTRISIALTWHTFSGATAEAFYPALDEESLSYFFGRQMKLRGYSETAK